MRQSPCAPAGDLIDLVRAAIRIGRDTPFELPQPIGYFQFLAGLMRVRGCTRVLEIGTEYGHSAASIAAGMGDAIDALVTCDINDKASILDGRRGVHRVIGDAMAQSSIRRILDLFGHRPIDVLYVDSGHDYPTTMAHVGTFASLLRPGIMLVDDIVLNEEMARFWSDIRAMYGDRAVNACDVDPCVRQCDCGFGVIVPYPGADATHAS
jgi:predicted O-methyltransferase YrrM